MREVSQRCVVGTTRSFNICRPANRTSTPHFHDISRTCQHFPTITNTVEAVKLFLASYIAKNGKDSTRSPNATLAHPRLRTARLPLLHILISTSALASSQPPRRKRKAEKQVVVEGTSFRSSCASSSASKTCRVNVHSNNHNDNDNNNNNTTKTTNRRVRP
jgi:hypothetical protein